MSKITFQWLKDYREIEFDIIVLEENLERSKRELRRWTDGDLCDVKLTSDSEGAKLEERIEKIEKDITFKKESLESIKNAVQKFNQVDHTILYARYIEGKTFDEIADETGYTKGTIYNKHASLMKTISYFDELTELI